MRHLPPARAVAVALLAITFGLAPALAEARPGVRGGGASSIRSSGGGGMRGGGGGGGFGASSRPSGGFSGGGARASTRPSGGGRADRSGDRMGNSSGNRVNGGDRINSGNRINGGDRVNSGDRVNNSGNRVNTGDININADNGWDWNDRYHPVAGAVAIGAVAGVTAAAVAGSMYYSLPPGCSPYPYGGYSYYHCGSAYYETRYEGDKVVYVVVDQP